MANLIITIISVALVAVAAIMGSWYGGQAFQSGQAKARATKIVSDQNQLAAAWHLYALNNGMSYRMPSGYTHITFWSDVMVPQYLNSVPRASFYQAEAFNPQASYINKSTGTLHSATTIIEGNAVNIYLLTESHSWTVCHEYIALAGEAGAYVPRSPPGYAISFSSVDFDKVQWICMFNDVDTSGDPSPGDVGFYFYYIIR
ncbi:MAG TPA: hypothetical protein PKW15_04380 [Alphaproteobacteria bacterium]|nr:hypothetical protein [Rhodospirillaceae bacterium]HRJ12463.1 hypothetical protein [Alphaproteobacteria bacterium]